MPAYGQQKEQLLMLREKLIEAKALASRCMGSSGLDHKLGEDVKTVELLLGDVLLRIELQRTKDVQG